MTEREYPRVAEALDVCRELFTQNRQDEAVAELETLEFEFARESRPDGNDMWAMAEIAIVYSDFGLLNEARRVLSLGVEKLVELGQNNDLSWVSWFEHADSLISTARAVFHAASVDEEGRVLLKSAGHLLLVKAVEVLDGRMDGGWEEPWVRYAWISQLYIRIGQDYVVDSILEHSVTDLGWVFAALLILESDDRPERECIVVALLEEVKTRADSIIDPLESVRTQLRLSAYHRKQNDQKRENDYLLKAYESTLGITDPDSQATYLNKIASRLNETQMTYYARDIIPRAVDVALMIEDPYQRASTLVSLARTCQAMDLAARAAFLIEQVEETMEKNRDKHWCWGILDNSIKEMRASSDPTSTD